MADEPTTLIIPADCARVVQEIKRLWERMQNIASAQSSLLNFDVEICEECQQIIADQIHDDGVAVDALARALNVRCANAHRTCYGPHRLTAEDIVCGTCMCGAKIVIEGASHE